MNELKSKVPNVEDGTNNAITEETFQKLINDRYLHNTCMSMEAILRNKNYHLIIYLFSFWFLALHTKTIHLFTY